MNARTTNRGGSFEVLLSGHDPKPVLAEDGIVTGWRCHAYDTHKRVFHATHAEGTVIVPLMEKGGGQSIIVDYPSSSTLARFVRFVDADLQSSVVAAKATFGEAATADDEPVRPQPIAWPENATLDERARIVFDATPSGHPSGRLPDWDMQPNHIHDVFRGFAARLPYKDFGAGSSEELPQTVLRQVADASWSRRAGGPHASYCAHVLWTAACILDLDDEGSNHMFRRTLRLTDIVESSEGHLITDDERNTLQTVVDRLCDIIETAGPGQASLPFRRALGLVDTVLDVAVHPAPGTQA